MEASSRPTPTPTTIPAFLWDAVGDRGQRARLDTGHVFLECGDPVDVFAVVLGGCLRVYVAGENGREITLYTVEAGECCTVNVLCLISGNASPAAAVVQNPLEALVFSRADFLAWLAERADFREFVFSTMTRRMTDIMALVEEVAFQRLDCRLAAYLVQGADDRREIRTTHDAVAADLGTAREVVSRLLKSFERQGAIELARGTITVKRPELLQRLMLAMEA
jgi:CRP/FNR family transcriptional regulator